MIANGQRVFIQSYLSGNYLQLLDNLEENDLAQFEHVVSHVNDPYLEQEDSKSSQLRLITHEY